MPGEEALDRAEAEGEPLQRQAIANFFDRGVPAWAERRHHCVMVRLDPIRTPIATKPRIALIALTLASDSRWPRSRRNARPPRDA